MATPRQGIADKTILDETMNRPAREYASLKPEDPRRAEIVQELSQLSLLQILESNERRISQFFH